MTNKNNLIQVDSLDFGGIKANLIEYLRGQQTYSDFNFEGSALSTLIDVLVYNTHYNALYTNMALNEAFIDSASKYSSVVSLAKAIGYTAKSIIASRAVITIEVQNIVNPDIPANVLPKNTMFRGTIGSREFLFRTIYDKSADYIDSIQNTYRFENVEVVEGESAQNIYSATLGAQFVIPNLNADIQTLSVKVRKSLADVSTSVYERATDFLSINRTDKVYFIKQREDLFYEVYFGNGVIGEGISAGNIINLEYVTTNGILANGASDFYYVGGYRGDVDIDVITISPAIGGSNAEQIDAIKYNAPRNYVAQNRAVTNEDYAVQIVAQFPQLEQITVWGGQEHHPKRYGYVLISAKPIGRDKLNSQEKAEILKFLEDKKQMMTIRHDFIDPEILEIGVNSAVYYDPIRTNKPSTEIAQIAKNTINSYSAGLGKFDSVFRFQNLSSQIDRSENSIVSNIQNIFLVKKIPVFYNTNYNYNFVIGNPIHRDQKSVTTNDFYIQERIEPCRLISDDIGNIGLYFLKDDGSVEFIRNIGNIDYNTGGVQITSLNIRALVNNSFEFTMIPSSYDVIPIRNYILVLPNHRIKVTAIPDSLSGSNNRASINYTFSNSR